MKFGEFDKYNGYKGTIEYDKNDKLYHGRLIGTDDIVCYHAYSIKKLYKNFKNATKTYGHILTLRRTNKIYQEFKRRL